MLTIVETSEPVNSTATDYCDQTASVSEGWAVRVSWLCIQVQEGYLRSFM